MAGKIGPAFYFIILIILWTKVFHFIILFILFIFADTWLPSCSYYTILYKDANSYHQMAYMVHSSWLTTSSNGSRSHVLTYSVADLGVQEDNFFVLH